MIKSYCKINLFLKVLKKNNNRDLHNVQSSTMILDLHDKINIKKIQKKKDEVLFTGIFKKDIKSNINTVVNTLSLLRRHNLIDKNKRYKIVVNKRIPVFAGLGGGTGNAATIIKYFLKNKVSSKLLKIFENKIGSDLRLFFLAILFKKI